MTARLRDDSNMKACWEEGRRVRAREREFKSRQGGSALPQVGVVRMVRRCQILPPV